ncbi:hypothetical protein ACH5RR_029551 [Cinchona calisaya]|uniref:Receptor ligand binding region domain-containing protein n=1 Tax=Cinchona calisaya TaxID=153742 RepID=A0ABD2YVH9_9GENT
MSLTWLLPVSILFLAGFSEEIKQSRVVNIGAILSFGTTNGRVAKIAMNAAVQDVNSDSRILGGNKLVLSIHDSNYSGFLGIIGALQYMETDTVAIIGPQTSVMAHVISHLANELHVLLLSFTALDPSITPLQYPYFIQTAPTDLYQMTAIADIIYYFGYREVIAIFTDDDKSRNGITILGDKLAERHGKISYKATIPPEPASMHDQVMEELCKIRMMESRVIVGNTCTKTGFMVFNVARNLGMTDKGYVWIATNWLSAAMDATQILTDTANSIQGVLTLRLHTPDSKIWMIANAVKLFLDHGDIISFSNYSGLNVLDGTTLNLDALSIFDGGQMLLKNILQTSNWPY